MIAGGIDGTGSLFPTGLDNLTNYVTDGVSVVNATLWNKLANAIYAVEKKLCVTDISTGASTLVPNMQSARGKANLVDRGWKRVFTATTTAISASAFAYCNIELEVTHRSYTGTPPAGYYSEYIPNDGIVFSVDFVPATSGYNTYPITVEIMSITTEQVDTVYATSTINALLIPAYWGWDGVAPKLEAGTYYINALGYTLPK